MPASRAALLFATTVRVAMVMTSAILVLVFLYIGAAIVGTIWIPLESEQRCNPDCDRDIFISLSPVHADIIVPLQPDDQWYEFLGSYGDKLKNASPRYLAFGWGSRTFYLKTPTWSDLTVSNLLQALFLDQSIIHVTPIFHELREQPDIRKVRMRDGDLLRLAHLIRTGFSVGDDGETRLITGAYGRFDAFFEARGRYSPLITCNVWAGNLLREVGVPLGLWTPFSWSLSYSLP